MVDAAPLYEDCAEAPENGFAHWVTTADGVRIRVAYWRGGDKGTVFIFPGRTEYIEKYGPAAGEFLARGYSPVVIDWRGQGLADRLIDDPNLGHIDHFSSYQNDVQAALEFVHKLDLPKPYMMCAHSMGGCIGLRTLMGNHEFKAAAFSAPMWGVLIKPDVLRPVAWAISSAASVLGGGGRKAPGTDAETYVVANPYDDNLLTKDRDMFDMMKTQATQHPDLMIAAPTVQWVGQSLREMLELSKQPSPSIPSITHLGHDERIVDPKRIKDRMERWTNGKLVDVPAAEHEIMMEIPATRDAFYDDAMALFDTQL